jgi:hypothetical protein
MNIAYAWNCKTVDVHPQENEESNVVYNVHWIVKGVSEELDSEGDPYTASSIGTQIVPSDADGTFIPFEDLTNEIVTGWVKESMGEETVTELEASIGSQINDLINPTSVTMTLKA